MLKIILSKIKTNVGLFTSAITLAIVNVFPVPVAPNKTWCLDELRHAATSSLLTNPDTIVVSSVSCIYGIGDPEDYAIGTISMTSPFTLKVPLWKSSWFLS